MKQIEIKNEPVELYKILKFEGFASSGAEAKLFISEGLLKVNGVVETRRRKKMVCGDILEFEDEKFILCRPPRDTVSPGDSIA